MIDEEYNFCLNYITEFVSILNYPTDTSSLEAIEEDREIELKDADNKYKNSEIYSSIINNINIRYDNMLFNYIKEEVANKNPIFINERLKSMSNLLTINKENVTKFKMVTPCKNINDYYQNYLIAINLVLSDKRYLRGE